MGTEQRQRLELREQTDADRRPADVGSGQARAGNAAPDAAVTDPLAEPAGASDPDGHHAFARSTAGGPVGGAGEDPELQFWCLSLGRRNARRRIPTQVVIEANGCACFTGAYSVRAGGANSLCNPTRLTGACRRGVEACDALLLRASAAEINFPRLRSYWTSGI
jgi:hypothetical protein